MLLAFLGACALLPGDCISSIALGGRGARLLAWAAVAYRGWGWAQGHNHRSATPRTGAIRFFETILVAMCSRLGWWAIFLACGYLHANMKFASAVRCFTCHDGIPGCAGGEACPFFTSMTRNARILQTGTYEVEEDEAAGIAAAAFTTLTCTLLLPRAILRVLTRGALDFFLSVARRRPVDRVTDPASMDSQELTRAVNRGEVLINDAMAVVLERVSRPGIAQAEVARWNAVSTALSHMERMGAHVGASGLSSNGGELLGSFTLAWALAGQVITQSQCTLALAGQAHASTSADGGRSEQLKMRIHRPASLAEFYHMLTVWMMVCQATGLAQVLVTGAFLMKVVHEQMAFNMLSWQVAHELFLVYLEIVETAPTSAEITLANVYDQGAMDANRERAAQRAREYFPGAKSKTPPDDGGDGIFRGQWKGAFSPNAKQCCITFNLGRKDHPSSSLDANGKCKYAHKCDHWVSDKGPGGICGSTKHGRVNCDNPNKCDQRHA